MREQVSTHVLVGELTADMSRLSLAAITAHTLQLQVYKTGNEVCSERVVMCGSQTS